MFLKHIQFINFRGFSDLKLSFEKSDGTIKGQTLLLGENGLGKSNLLKGVALVTAGSSALGDLLGDPDDWIQFGKEECVISAILQTQKKEERKIELKIIRGHDLREIILGNQASLSEIDQALKHTERNFFAVGYGASRRLNRGNTRLFSSEKKTSSFRAQNVDTLFNPDALLQPLAAWAMELDYRSNGKELGVIKKAINEFLPDVKFDKIDRKNGVILFKSKFHTQSLPLHLLSDGYQNVASWIGDLLYRITNSLEDYRDPLATRGLLLIDEVDLHLHPKWQRILLDFIRKKLPNFQLIATTHSPLTAQQADEEELYVLNRDDDNEIAIKPFVGSPKYMLVSQLLMSPMFGLETDESLKVETLKKEYKELKGKSKTNKSAASKIKKVKEQIQQLPVQPLKSDVFLKEKEEMIARLSAKAKVKL